MRRRDFLGMPVALGGMAAMSGAGMMMSGIQSAKAAGFPVPAAGNSLGVKAMVFDTFGTVVDWRGSIIREAAGWGRERNLQIDWGKFADQWRAGYGPSMDKVRKGVLPWMKLDDLHRMILDDLLQQYHITGLTEEEKVHWTNVWHRLSGWPDAVEGLTRLKGILLSRRYRTGMCHCWWRWRNLRGCRGIRCSVRTCSIISSRIARCISAPWIC